MNQEHRKVNQTVSGIGPGNWNSALLAQEQERKALNTAVLYRLYTENLGHTPTFVRLISRYFSGASILYGTGVWEKKDEPCAIIEVIATSNDLQSIVHLAGDIKVQNHQSSVLVTWQSISRLDV